MLHTNRGSKVALEIEIGYNKKTKLISHQKKRMETGFFKKTSRLLKLTR
jgi:hypothetical protein